MSEHATEHDWLEGYLKLALRIGRATQGGGHPLLDYRGPAQWRDEVATEEPPPPGSLVNDADRLLDQVPFPPPRGTFLAAHVRSLRTVARRLAGEELPLRDYARRCLGLEVEWVPESVFEAAHAQLDAALPGAGGSLTARLQAWQEAHRLPAPDMDRLPELVRRAVAETRARTGAIVPLPEETVDCQLVTGVAFHGAGGHHGGGRSTIYVNRDVPFNLADLLYLVAHEGHPGHIAESVLKETHLVGGLDRHEQQARFLVSPQFVLGEGLGLHAQALVFPGDEAQAWLTDHVLAGVGIRPDGSDFAAIHEARTALWGAWANAALLLADGRPDGDVKDYLARWALLSDAELAALGPTMSMLKVPYAEPYTLCYYHGWRLVRAWLDGDPRARARRLLTEELLPADLEYAADLPDGRGSPQ